LVTFAAVTENFDPSVPGIMAAVLTGLIVPVPPRSGPPKRHSAFTSADQNCHPANLPKSNSSVACAVALYSLPVSVPPEATP
jgi:hypothetical protein